MEKKQVLIFSVDYYSRPELERMGEDDLIALVTQEAIRCDRADFLSLASFQELLNNQEIDMDGWWVYFVNY